MLFKRRNNLSRDVLGMVGTGYDYVVVTANIDATISATCSVCGASHDRSAQIP